jgi:hypothetical protein
MLRPSRRLACSTLPSRRRSTGPTANDHPANAFAPRAAQRRRPRWIVAAIAAATAAACGPSAQEQQRLAQLDSVSAEKDSLLAQVAENARLMSEIGVELARVNAPSTTGTPEAPLAVTRDSLFANIHTLTTRLQQSEARLVESEQRIAALSGEKSGFQRTIGELRGSIDNQKRTIASLTSQVEALRGENTRLVVENVALSATNVALADTVTELTDRDNTVYYVIGTRDDLIARGIVEEEGGSRVLFVFGKRGKTLVPARSLDPAEFIATDRRTFTDIPLAPATDYEIASRQDIAALDPPPDEEGRLSGPVRIVDADRFWAGGRYLIVVQR